MSIITWLIIIIGAILILVSTLTFKRKGEAELSANVTETPLFRIGAVVLTLGLLVKIVLLFV